MADVMDLIERQDTDAKKWAEAFCEATTPGDEISGDQVDLMVGWFANAMSVAEDACRNREQAEKDEDLPNNLVATGMVWAIISSQMGVEKVEALHENTITVRLRNLLSPYRITVERIPQDDEE